ncbi:hypothetical protein GpartN1_g2384.t1 [Galdieria partita]|uniref:Uncharacterized protein n=1 Tax=Galdieria partita TaxID=83374 RepID=A0A9C7PTM0_9RHOD|nr:hypothetical protein GpartN1_g2384.t1 [Galdieria partita]
MTLQAFILRSTLTLQNTRKRFFCRNCQSAYRCPLNSFAKRSTKYYHMKSDIDTGNQNLSGKEFSKSPVDADPSWKSMGENTKHNGNPCPPGASNPREEAQVKIGANSVNQHSFVDRGVEVVSENVPDWLYRPAVARDFPRPKVPSSPELIHRYEQRRRFFSPYPGRAVLVCIGALVSLATPSRAPVFYSIPVQFVAISMIVLHVVLLFIWLFGVNGAAANLYTPTEEEYNKIVNGFASSETIPIMPAERKEDFGEKVGLFWSSTILSPPTWALILGLLESGVSAPIVSLAVCIGGLVAVALTTLLGHPSVKYGVPLPVICHSSFSFELIHFPLNIKLVLGLLWFALSCWIGGESLTGALTIFLPNTKPLLIRSAGYSLFWLWQLFMVWIYNGTRKPNETKIHFWNYWLPEKAVPELLYKYVHYLFLVLLLGSCFAISQFSHLTPMSLIKEAYHRITIPGAMKFGILFPLVNAFASLWSFQILTAPNLARRLPSQSSHLTCTLGGIVPSTFVIALLSPLIVSSIVLTFGSYASRMIMSSPTLLTSAAGHATGSVAIKVSMFLLLATVAYASNMRACMETLSHTIRLRFLHHVYSTRISTTIGILLSILCPWYLLCIRPNILSHIWIPVMGTLAGPLTGVLLCEYFIIRRMDLRFYDLYNPYDGKYEYLNFENPVASASVILGMLPCLRGLLGALGIFPGASKLALQIWHSSFFSTMVSGATLYYLITMWYRYWHKLFEWILFKLYPMEVKSNKKLFRMHF